jgi:hypothetical protein
MPPMTHREPRSSWGLALGVVVLSAICGLVQSGCGSGEPPADKVLQLEDVVTGWMDDGIVDEGGTKQNKLVPLISYKVKNTGQAAVSYVSFNAVFKVIDDPEELGAALLKGIDGDGLPPGKTAGPFVARSQLGYTSPAPRMQMLQHSLFKDAQVELFSKHRSGGWIKIGQYKIQRQVLTPDE